MYWVRFGGRETPFSLEPRFRGRAIFFQSRGRGVVLEKVSFRRGVRFLPTKGARICLTCVARLSALHAVDLDMEGQSVVHFWFL